MQQELENLITQFIGFVEEYAKTKDIKARVIRQYGKKKGSGYRVVSSVLDYDTFKVRFAYVIDEGAVFKKGIITLFLNIGEYEYHFCDFLAKLAPKDKDCIVFPYIDNIESMKTCLNILFQKLDSYEQSIVAITSDDKKRASLQNMIKKEIKIFSGKEILKEGPLSLMISGIYSNTSLIRYTSKPYKCYLNGEYKRALKLYNKEGNLALYEKQLVKQMLNMLKKNIKQDIPNGQKTINHKDEVKKESTIYTIITFILLLPVMFLISYVIYTAFLNVVARDTLLLLKPSIIFLTVPSVAQDLAFTVNIRDKIFKSRLNKTLRFKVLYSTESRVKRTKIYINSIVIASIITIALVAASSITLREDGIKYSKDILDFTGTIVPYSDVDLLDTTTGEIKLKSKDAILLETYEYDTEALWNVLKNKIKK